MSNIRDKMFCDKWFRDLLRGTPPQYRAETLKNRVQFKRQCMRSRAEISQDEKKQHLIQQILAYGLTDEEVAKLSTELSTPDTHPNLSANSAGVAL